MKSMIKKLKSMAILPIGMGGLMQASCASAATTGQGDWLSGFTAIGSANWSENRRGEIFADRGSGFLVSKTSYDNFHLKVDFMAGSGTNSGVFFRCSYGLKIDDKSCYEANIFDSRPDQAFRTGAITGHTPPKVILNAEDGAWHTYEVYAVRDQIRVLLDGKETAYTRSRERSAGPVALQFAQGEVKFRGLSITPLPADALKAKTSIIDGVWELQAMHTVDGEGNVSPWCPGSFGVIIYAEGHMSTAVNCTSDPTKNVLYSGPFRIEDRMVYHHVQNYSSGSLNKVFGRRFELIDEDHLELSGDLGDSKVVVKWVRR